MLENQYGSVNSASPNPETVVTSDLLEKRPGLIIKNTKILLLIFLTVVFLTAVALIVTKLVLKYPNKKDFDNLVPAAPTISDRDRPMGDFLPSSTEKNNPTPTIVTKPKIQPTSALVPSPTKKPTSVPTAIPTNTPMPTAVPTPPDTTPPVIDQMTGPENGGVYSYKNFCFPMHATDNAPGTPQVRYKFDSESWSGWGNEYSPCYSNVANGSHTFSAQAKDAAGNESGITTRTFTIQAN